MNPADSPGIRSYVWVAEGETYAGTLREYARHLEVAHYQSVEVGPLHELGVEGDHPVLIEVDLQRSVIEGDDVRHVVLRHENEGATYRIDLRS